MMDTDPVRRLSARYDGYLVPEVSEGLESAEIAVTATGCAGAITMDMLQSLGSDTVLVNAGQH